MELKYQAKRTGDKVQLTVSSFINGELRYSLEAPGADYWPVIFFTATTDMRDFIGNVVAVDPSGLVCSVKGAYRGNMQRVNNVFARGREPIGLHQRVMVTEHISTDGKFEFIATKKRVLHGDLNFINLGWSNESRCKHWRIDAYTGDSKLIVGAPCFAFLRDK